MTITSQELVRDQLMNLVAGLYRRSTRLFGKCPEGVSVTYVVRDLVARLYAIDDEAASAAAASEVAECLISEPDGEEFWRTPLGRLVSWHIGYPDELVPLKLVGTLIGISRQYGYKVAYEANLAKTLRGGFLFVSRRSVRDLIRERRPAGWSV
jgi:hypothetical protein